MTTKHILGILGLCLLTLPLFAQEKDSKTGKDVAPKKAPAKPGEVTKKQAADPVKEKTPVDKKTEEKRPDVKKPEVTLPVLPKVAPRGKILRDPTAPQGFRNLRRGQGQRTQIRATQLPEIRLKGRVLMTGKEPAALIEIEKRILVIRLGTELTLNTKSSVFPNAGTTKGAKPQAFLTGLVLKVTKLTASDIQFEVLATKQTVIVR